MDRSKDNLSLPNSEEPLSRGVSGNSLLSTERRQFLVRICGRLTDRDGLQRYLELFTVSRRRGEQLIEAWDAKNRGAKLATTRSLNLLQV